MPRHNTVSITLEIMQTQEKSHLQKDLFKCIYSLFQAGFLEWIINHFQHRSMHRDKLWADAKDAFQNGLETFFHKPQKEGFSIKESNSLGYLTYNNLVRPLGLEIRHINYCK